MHEAAPVWDETTSLFWCPSGINAYDLPDGHEWQSEFRSRCEDLLEEQLSKRSAPAAATVAPAAAGAAAATAVPAVSEAATSAATAAPAAAAETRPSAANAVARGDVCGVPTARETRPTAADASLPKGLGRRPSKVLVRHLSDAPTPQQQMLASPQAQQILASPQAQAQRKLARFPSDPDKRRFRAVHSSALRKMSIWAGQPARVQGRDIVFFRFEGKVFASDALCPHQGAHLWEGEIGDIEDMVTGRHCFVTCPVHKFQFDLATGALLEGGHGAQGCKPLRTYRVRIREADDKQKVAIIEVGFESLAEAGNYFGDPDAMDCDDA